MGTTEKIAQFIVDISLEKIPRDVVDKAKRTVLDCIGAALAGVSEPVSQTIIGYATKLGGPAQASVFATGVKISVADAALANGTIAHALDYDDCGVKIGHPSVLVLPAVLSFGEQLRATGQEILTAYIVGLEVEGKLALHADFKLMQARLNHQTWYGSMGAAAACSKLLRLDVDKTRMALGIAGNFACGLSVNHGSMAGAMAAGNACRNGVIAALMAQAGITANPNIVEAKNGFYDTLVGRDHYDAERTADSLGKPFYIESPGIGLKKYPSCYHTHRALDGVLQLLGEYRLNDKDIAEVDVGTSERAMRVLAFTEPATPYQAKFSMPHCIAAALVDCQVTLETFTPRKFEERSIVQARKKVHLSFPDVPIWPGLADVGPDTEFVGNPVTIKTNDGKAYSVRVDIPRGDPALPLSDDELLEKYRDCVRSQLRPDELERSMGLVLGLEQLT
ncbi:MAG TPA: MmgE/PrpD family protein, partial [Candidatus Binatia bacterium]